jgi:hypothetical protein
MENYYQYVLPSLVAGIFSLITLIVTAWIQKSSERVKTRTELMKEYVKREDIPEQVKEVMEDQIKELDKKENEDLPGGTKKRFYQVLGIIAIGVIAWVVSFLVFSKYATSGFYSPRTFPNAMIDNFEGALAPEWSTPLGNPKINFSDKYVFDGKRSLSFDLDLNAIKNWEDSEGIFQFILEGKNLQNKLAIFRAYAPEDAPTNLYAGLFLVDAQNHWRTGTTTNLTPGHWETLVWSTQDAPSWEPPAKLGLQIVLLPGTNPNDRPDYSGTIYVDMVELLSLPDAFPSMETVLESVKEYTFSEKAVVPSEISEIRGENTKEFSLSDEYAHEPYGGDSLRVDLDLDPYDAEAETGFGGIYLNLEKATRVDAINTYIFIPERSDVHGASDFAAYYVAIDNEGDLVYGASSPITIDRWTPLFWGTSYAYSGENLCKDEDNDDVCDEKAGIWWHEWMMPEIQGFYVRIVRAKDSYTGPVYFDDLGIYQVRR